MLKDVYNLDPISLEVLEALEHKDARHPLITLANYEKRGAYLYYLERLYIPDHDELKAEILRLCHDSPTAGHSGRSKTYELLT